jgi:hypothetical protein
MRMPGFTAEASLYKAGERYRQKAAGFIPVTDGIVPANQCCAPCGKDLCCDECPTDPPPDDPHGGRFRGGHHLA